MDKIQFISRKKLLGAYILIIGLIIILKIVFPNFKFVYLVLSFLMMISLNLIITSFYLPKSKKLIIPGVTVFLLSLFLLLYFLVFINMIEFRRIWPAIGLFPAISLILFYIMSANKNPATIIPGIFISILSIILLLITTKILQLKFVNFMVMLFAGMFIIIGLFLIFNNEINFDKKKSAGKKQKK